MADATSPEQTPLPEAWTRLYPTVLDCIGKLSAGSARAPSPTSTPVTTEELSAGFETLATLCGANPDRRELAGPLLASMLEQYNPIVLPAGLTRQLLRFIGNSCADCNKNRDIAVRAYVSISATVETNPELIPFTLTVMFNTFNGYTAAQHEFLKLGLHALVVDLLEKDFSAKLPHPLMMDILTVLLGPDDENDAKLRREAAEQSSMPNRSFITRAILLLQTDILGEDEYLALVDILVWHLDSPPAKELRAKQDQFVIESAYGLLRKLADLFHAHGGVDLARAIQVPPKTEGRQEALRKRIALAIDAASQFFIMLASGVEITAENWASSELYVRGRELAADPSAVLQPLGWLLLGNVVVSDQISAAIVAETDLPAAAIAALRQLADAAEADAVTTATAASETGGPDILDNGAGGANSTLAHALSGFLTNLAIAVPNRAALGQAGLLDVLTRLVLLDWDPAVAGYALALARKLVNTCPENCDRALSPANADVAAGVGTRPSLLDAVTRRWGLVLGKHDVAVAHFLAVLYKTVQGRAGEAEIGPEAAGAAATVASPARTFMMLSAVLADQPTDGRAFVDVWFALALLSTTGPGAAAVAHSLGLAARDPPAFAAAAAAANAQRDDARLQVRRQVASSAAQLRALPGRAHPPLTWARLARTVTAVAGAGADGAGAGADGAGAAGAATAGLPLALREMLAENGLLLVGNLLAHAREAGAEAGLDDEVRAGLEGIVREGIAEKEKKQKEKETEKEKAGDEAKDSVLEEKGVEEGEEGK